MKEVKKKVVKKTVKKVSKKITKTKSFQERLKLNLIDGGRDSYTCRESVTSVIQSKFRSYDAINAKYVLIKDAYIEPLSKMIDVFLDIARTYTKNKDVVHIDSKGLWVHKSVASRQYVSLLTGLIRVFKNYPTKLKHIEIKDIDTMKQVLHASALTFSVPLFLYTFTGYSTNKIAYPAGRLTPTNGTVILDVIKMKKSKTFQKELLTNFAHGQNGIMSWLRSNYKLYNLVFTKHKLPKNMQKNPLRRNIFNLEFYN